MLQPGRTYSAGNAYRYGFNGKEADSETSGQGNQYDYGFRIYNPRLGKFLSVDPLFKTYPFYTPYQFGSNNPVLAIDVDGLESSNDKNPTLPRNPYAGIDWHNPPRNFKYDLISYPFGDVWKNREPYCTNVTRPENAPVGPDRTYYTDLPYAFTGGDELHKKHAKISELGIYTTDPGFQVFDMKSTPSGTTWNEYTESKNYFMFNGTTQGSQKSLINFLLGNYIKGVGPINYVFPVNGESSEFLRNAGIVTSALSDWVKNGSKDEFTKKSGFGIMTQLMNLVDNKILTLENFVGSADVTINKLNDKQIIVRIYNVTSITSGDISKHMFGKKWIPSVVADPNNSSAQPYSNILQIYQLTFDISSTIYKYTPQRPIDKR